MQINETENRKTLEEINKIKNWFIENINKRDKHLPRLSKKKRTKTQATNIWNERVCITNNVTAIKRIMKAFHKQMYVKN